VTPAARGLRIPQLLHPPSSARRHIAKHSIHHPPSPTRRRPFAPESRGITTSCNCSFHLFLSNYTLSPYSASNTLVPFYLGCLWGLVGSSITRPPEAFLLSAPLLSSPCPDLTSPPTSTTAPIYTFCCLIFITITTSSGSSHTSRFPPQLPLLPLSNTVDAGP